MNGFVSWSGNCSILLCWTSLVAIMNLSSGANSTTLHDQPPSRAETPDKMDIESDLSFLRNRDYFPFSSQSVRPYSLSTNEEDYHYAPKPKHLRPARLIRLLGSSFDPFWMSIERPPEADVWMTEDEVEAVAQSQKMSRSNETVSSLPNYTTKSKGFNISASPELTESAARYQRKLEKEAEDLDLRSLPAEVASSIRDWLVRSARCGLRYQWVNLGPVFWPRWLRHTDCYKVGGSQTCSFPSGMACRRAQVTQLKILAWHCWGNEEAGGSGARGKKVGEKGTGITGKKCLWRQVPYPVVTACKCSCK